MINYLHETLAGDSKQKSQIINTGRKVRLYSFVALWITLRNHFFTAECFLNSYCSHWMNANTLWRQAGHENAENSNLLDRRLKNVKNDSMVERKIKHDPFERKINSLRVLLWPCFQKEYIVTRVSCQVLALKIFQIHEYPHL